MGDQTFQTGGRDAIPSGFAPRPVGGGFMEAAGPIYVRRDATGRGTFGLLIESRHCNAKDMCHGGMLAALTDVVLGIGGLEQTGVKGFFITVSLTQDFLAPVPLGSWLEAEVELLRQTSSTMFVQGVFRVRGKAALRASGVFRLPRPEG
ncbi:MAG TPA: PaaI family thioesterase [Acetobacteraceae bacterium]|nr:PaaI family thioesterase [Acetobacteraceae bacterium]